MLIQKKDSLSVSTIAMHEEPLTEKIFAIQAAFRWSMQQKSAAYSLIHEQITFIT